MKTTTINILVTGSSGQLGQEIKYISDRYTDFNFFFASKNELDIRDESATKLFIQKNTINYCINAAAYTQVDKAEEEIELNSEINTIAVGYLSSALNEVNATLIHISTDYVYDNDLRRPLLESDPTHPKSQYALAKLVGEFESKENNHKTIIIRTSWVFSSFGSNFVNTMLRLLSSRDSISVVNDQIGCPTYARDLAQAIMTIITTLNTNDQVDSKIYKTYNYCNEGIVSWFDFAITINKLSGLNKKIISIPSEDYPTPASRPKYSVLNTSLIKNTFGLNIPSWKDGLNECIKKD